ncbi:MAG: WYL domain-containing protein [Deltaproteobacteria bacterium]|nr:WYL domain-containing protein [Deltaproteobacteria bacterium]
MPEKISRYASYGEKLIKLFAKLLFSGRSYSLTELSRMLGCSKQSVMRLMDDITRSYGVEVEETIEERHKYYRIRKPGHNIPILNLTHEEMGVLLMCQAFARHLLGSTLFDEASQALEKNRALLEGQGVLPAGSFTSYRPGSIDYTPHEGSIRILLQAMETNTVCKITYRSLSSERAKTYFIIPLKIFSHNDTIYLSARYAGKPGRPVTIPEYDPLLVVHRIRKVELTGNTFEFPKDYDFETTYNLNFGIIKQDAFNVEAEFTGIAATYVAERIWSPDQKITRKPGGKVRLVFSASSQPELISWLLSFGDNARLIKPEWLQEKMHSTIQKMQGLYSRE